MDTLRWVLLFLGAIILIALYLFGKRAEARRKDVEEVRDEPRFDETAAAPAEDETAADDEWEIIPIHRQEAETPLMSEPEAPSGEARRAEPHFVSPAREKTETSPAARQTATRPQGTPEEEADFEEVLIMHVVSTGAPLRGSDLEGAFSELGLTLDNRGIYVRHDVHADPPLFGVVNMVKPGVFAPDVLDSLETPGISLFLTLPGPESPMIAFRAMRDCAKGLAERLHARLEDETHSTLSTQTLTHMEERVRQFIQHHARVAGPTR